MGRTSTDLTTSFPVRPALLHQTNSPHWLASLIDGSVCPAETAVSQRNSLRLSCGVILRWKKSHNNRQTVKVDFFCINTGGDTSRARINQVRLILRPLDIRLFLMCNFQPALKSAEKYPHSWFSQPRKWMEARGQHLHQESPALGLWVIFKPPRHKVKHHLTFMTADT